VADEHRFWCVFDSSGTMLLAPHPFWKRLPSCQSTIAHSVLDLGSAQANFG
jgi:hypothetical protein